MAKAAKVELLVEKLSPKYVLYAEWLESEHELVVPADHLQVALRNYMTFQKSDVNKAANAASKAARAVETDEDEDETPAPKAKAKAKASKAKAAPVETDEDETPAPKAKAKAPKRTASKAAF